MFAKAHSIAAGTGKVIAQVAHRVLSSAVAAQLADTGTSESALTGTVFLLKNNRVLRKISQQWSHLNSFLLATANLERHPIGSQPDKGFKLHSRVAVLVESFHAVAARPPTCECRIARSCLPHSLLDRSCWSRCRVAANRSTAAAAAALC